VRLEALVPLSLLPCVRRCQAEGWRQGLVLEEMSVNSGDHTARQSRRGAGPPRRSFWVTPEWYGTHEALASMGTIAAPLLGGFSLAAMVQTLVLTPGDLRWRDAALLLFMLAAVFFIGTVQVTFWARQYQASPSEIKSWWPDADTRDRLVMLQREQKVHAAGFRTWSNRARVSYSIALLCFLAGLTVLAVPAASAGHVPLLRWVAVAVGVLAFLAEAAWILGSFTTSRWKWAARLMIPEPDDLNDRDLPRGPQ
jgi:hypothetical protein